MCHNCKVFITEITAKGTLTNKEINNYMDKIVLYISQTGESPEHFQEVIDILLQTSMTDRDSDSEREFHNKVNNGQD